MLPSVHNSNPFIQDLVDFISDNGNGRFDFNRACLGDMSQFLFINLGQVFQNFLDTVFRLRSLIGGIIQKFRIVLEQWFGCRRDK